MKKTNKIILLIIIISILELVSVFSFGAYFLFLHHRKGTEKIEIWSESDEFDINNIQVVNKQKNKDFVILNLADIQICDIENFFNMKIIHDEISYLVEKTKPDLITLTGDQTWSNENLISLKSIISWLDSYKIPYAPIFGNHDYGNEKNSSVAELNYCCDLYEKGKYSLFKRGPSNLGSLGNYVINIKEDNTIIKTLYMIDSGYEDKISDEQIAWLKWNADGIKKVNNNQYTEGMCFMHKPIPQYYNAYYNYLYDSNTEVIGNVNVHYSLYGSSENGFFDKAKICNIKDIVCGHQHGNNFTIKYEDVRLTFACKTGELGGYYDDGITNLNGATIFTINNANTLINNIYVKSGEYHFKNSDNCYN